MQGPGEGALAGRHVLLGVSGGIAAYKAAALARALVQAGATVQPILTTGAATFVGPVTFAGLTGRPVHAGVFAEADRILHVELAREADVAIFAPATANLLAKFAAGMADDLVTTVFTCLTCPVVVAPAMHAEMWLHPATQANVAVLRERGTRVCGPDDGALAGGDTGPGRLAELDDLMAALRDAVAPAPGPLTGTTVLVTAGGTREPIDPVRYIGNRSSGKMGYRLAEEASRRGARVHLVSAPTHLPAPPGVTLHPVETAEEMRTSVMGLVHDADVVLAAAAVADVRPVTRAAQKLKKGEEALAAVPLEATPDILAEVGRSTTGKVLVGFAAETHREEDHGREKLRRKHLDLIVVNRVDAADAGFNVDTNRAVLLSADGARTEVPLTTKATLAAVICDHVEALLDARARRPSTLDANRSSK